MSYIGTKEFFFEVSKGKVAGHSSKVIFGHNPDVATGAAESIWIAGGNLVLLASAETMNIKSTSASDTSAGTGVRTVRITGLNASYVETSETITMNGTTNVLTVNSYLRVHEIMALTAGTGQINAGEITATASTAATVQCQLMTGQGTSENIQITIPAGKTGYIIHAMFSAAKPAGGGTPIIELSGQISNFASNVWNTVFNIQMDTTVSNIIELNQPVQIPIPEKTDIRILVSTTANNTIVFGRLFLILVDN